MGKKLYRVKVRKIDKPNKILDKYFIIAKNKGEAEIFACDIFIDHVEPGEFEYDDIYGQAKQIKVSKKALTNYILTKRIKKEDIYIK